MTLPGLGPINVQLITTHACAGPDCTTCGDTAALLRDLALGLGIRLSAEIGTNRPRLEVGMNPQVRLVIQHLGYKASPELLEGKDPPVLRVDGEVRLAGPEWGDPELRSLMTALLGEVVGDVDDDVASGDAADTQRSSEGGEAPRRRGLLARLFGR